MFTNLVLDGGDLCIIVTVVTIICHPPDGDSPLNILHQIVLLVRYASRAGLWEDNDPSLSVTCYRWEISRASLIVVIIRIYGSFCHHNQQP